MIILLFDEYLDSVKNMILKRSVDVFIVLRSMMLRE